ncbi:Cdc6/Cdc18 family protein [Haloarcula pellucida]|uniref:Cell division control protein Cdc6 n=1 Tax=Haloarcula pellucida TaxID=1427151 RepID=A0A830GF90_9EURY|nr:AAA family ATPase [Halomicroarcula pellucida]MBX0346597.1 AAA family ATPase [Halomicroarcula pellucida]GGN84468.1 cell division control protein Cdc6 [Halomicroarcula pellucida]
MIVDRSVFDDSHLPQRLQHRDAEVNQLARALEPAKQGDPADDLLISGPPGVGKSVLTRHTIDRLATRADVQYARIECMGQTTASIIRDVLGAIGDRPPQNTAREDLCLQLRERVTDPVVVVLDEASEVHETKALDRLADVEYISMVVICYDPDDWLSQAPNRIARRFHGRQLRLDRYGVDELADILEPRAREGLEHGAVARDQLETIADEVAGVARFGIYSLLAAATLAKDRGHDEVLDVDVADAYPLAQEWMRQAALDSLAFHHHVLYEIIREAETIDSRTLHQRYDAIADDIYAGRQRTPLIKRTRRDKLAKLHGYDLIGQEGGTKDRIYWVLDESVRSGYDIDVRVAATKDSEL